MEALKSTSSPCSSIQIYNSYLGLSPSASCKCGGGVLQVFECLTASQEHSFMTHGEGCGARKGCASTAGEYVVVGQRIGCVYLPYTFSCCCLSFCPIWESENLWASPLQQGVLRTSGILLQYQSMVPRRWSDFSNVTPEQHYSGYWES